MNKKQKKNTETRILTTKLWTFISVQTRLANTLKTQKFIKQEFSNHKIQKKKKKNYYHKKATFKEIKGKLKETTKTKTVLAKSSIRPNKIANITSKCETKNPEIKKKSNNRQENKKIKKNIITTKKRSKISKTDTKVSRVNHNFLQAHKRFQKKNNDLAEKNLNPVDIIIKIPTINKKTVHPNLSIRSKNYSHENKNEFNSKKTDLKNLILSFGTLGLYLDDVGEVDVKIKDVNWQSEDTGLINFAIYVRDASEF